MGINELITNAVKYAFEGQDSPKINIIAIKRQEDKVRLVIQDNGKGFEPGEFSAKKPALGLLSMRERAAMLGGNFTLRTSKGNGTRIRIEIPVKEISHD